MSSTNPLLAGLKLPGRIFQLPSKGLFYKNGELSESVKNGEIHVHPMSALDEINMKNPDQLFSGEAVNTVFKHCIEGIDKPSELLAKDIDAIMIFLRAVTYGPQYEFTAKHICKDAKDHSYTCDLDTVIGAMPLLSEEDVEQKFTVDLENGQIVKLQPNRYSQIVDLIKANQNKKEFTTQDQQDNLVKVIVSVIESVNGISDVALIQEWVTKLPSPMISKIGSKVEEISNWGADLKVSCTCKDCGEVFSVEIPINPVTFFNE